jgi:hypothetical protein
MIQNRKRTAPDGFSSVTVNETRGDGEEEKELRVRSPSRQEIDVGLSSSLGDFRMRAVPQSYGAIHQMQPSDPASLFPQPCLANGMFSLVGNNGSIQQLDLLHHLWTSRRLVSVDAFKSRIGVMQHSLGMDPVSSTGSSFHRSDSRSNLSVQAETAQQSIQNDGVYTSTKVPCRARGMSNGHNFEVSKERELMSRRSDAARKTTQETSDSSKLMFCNSSSL